MRWLRRSVWVVLVVGLVVGSHYFVQKNGQAVTLDFAAFRFEAVALWLVLLTAFGSGFAAATVIASLRGARLRLESRRYRREARDLEAEVHELRTLPLAAVDEPLPAAEAGPDDGLARGS